MPWCVALLSGVAKRGYGRTWEGRANNGCEFTIRCIGRIMNAFIGDQIDRQMLGNDSIWRFNDAGP